MKRIFNKSIKRDILIGLIFFFIAIGTILDTVGKNIYFKSFEELEKIGMEKNIGIVKNEIDHRLKELVTHVASWAIWDDTYLFAQGLDENYIKRYLNYGTFDLLEVDIIMVSDDSGKILHGGQRDFDTGNIKVIDQVVSEEFIKSGILKNKDPHTVFNDILIIDGSPILVGSHPILKTDGTGPVQGNLLFGRTWNENMMNEISKKLNLEVSFDMISKVELDKLNLKDEKGIELHLQNDDYIIGSYYMPGLFEQYYTKINVEMPRNAMKAGYNSIRILRKRNPLIYILILLAFWFFLDKLVISRIIKMNRQVIKIKEEKSIFHRIDIDDRADEITELSQGINNMLDNIENLQDEVYETNSKLEAKVLDRTNKLKIANERLEMEVNERKKIQDQITFFAYHDVLTGLPNRLLLTDRVRQGILHASREKTLISIMFIDLDGFKMLNDTLGHDQGDELLKQVSKRLLSVVRKNDTVSRLGGDEFILYINDYKDEKNLDIIASKIINAFKQPFILDHEEYYITGSIGISQYPKDGEEVETLIKKADNAMYRAKNLGKNQYQKY